jgi:hypothetical protein
LKKTHEAQGIGDKKKLQVDKFKAKEKIDKDVVASKN